MFRLSAASNPTIAATSSVLNVDQQIIASTILHYRVEEDEANLEVIHSMIQEFNQNLAEFQPALAVVATWQITSATQRLVKGEQHFSCPCTTKCDIVL